ncbi:probable serine/threonine-protein kinase At1g54610 [Ananas comosus]|uniref:[RNA-polymerase]-subunit kinase n=1 Tax=Ananas comosus TaxID=4615 RepID=A0A6P5GUT7_ANACO|nr:probable serine/threonine-protein kinase At1g54610 [Ananas comosus]
MGCICSKGIATEENVETLRKASISSKSLKRFVTLSKKGEAIVPSSDAPVIVDGGGTLRVNSKPKENGVVLIPVTVDAAEKKKAGAVAAAATAENRARKPVGHHRRATVDVGANGTEDDNARVGDAEPNLGIGGVPNGFSGEHAIAGWPSWLTAVAGEAVKGWLPRRADSFEKLDKIGQGTYSNVYRARDLETSKVVALKKVRFVNMDPESVRFMAREIHILRRLDHPNVIKLEGIVTSRMSNSLYLVFEYMEHDLAGLAATPGLKFTEPQVKCYMQQLLRGLDHCHSRGVLHRDIKGSNLLIDNNGNLRIADFGLATFFNPDQKQPLTSRVVTLWYRPPELLLGATEYGVAVDLWSTGCILAELLAGKPIMPGRTEVEQLHKIFKLCGSPSEEYWKKSKLPHATIFKPQHQYRRCFAETFKDFPPPALALLDSLLAIEPAARGTAASALQSEFFRTKPYACDTSSLPKYPPSKEYDAKLRDEEVRRQKAAAINGRGAESIKPRRKESKANPVPNANAELQKRHVQANPKSRSVKYSPLEDSGAGFPIEPPGLPAAMHTAQFGSTWYNKKGNHDDHRGVPERTYSSVRVANGPQLKTQRSYKPQAGGTDLHSLSVSAAGRSTAHPRYNRLDIVESSEKHVLDRPASSHKKDLGVKDSAVGYGGKIKRIHYSGPLMPPGGNVEDMLKEHERQIQQAVRKARLGKDKTNK